MISRSCPLLKVWSCLPQPFEGGTEAVVPGYSNLRESRSTELPQQWYASQCRPKLVMEYLDLPNIRRRYSFYINTIEEHGSLPRLVCSTDPSDQHVVWFGRASSVAVPGDGSLPQQVCV